MITLLASITGFISSIFPEILKSVNDRVDKKHELSILEKQIELQKANLSNRLEEIAYASEAFESKALYNTYNSGVTWVDALNATVRPVLAYSFFFLYTAMKYLQFHLHDPSLPIGIFLDILWTSEDQAIFAGIISFYFGQRAISKLKR